MTETTDHAARRDRYAAGISKGGFGQSLRELTDAAIAVADAEQADLRTANERMRHELEVMYGGAFDSLPVAAATVPASAPTDRAALRERIAALFRCPPGAERLGDATPGEIADAVLAEIPEATRLHDEILTLRADLAKLRDLLRTENKRANDAITRETTTEEAEEEQRLALSQALGLGTGAPWDAIRDRAVELAAPADRAAVLASVVTELEALRDKTDVNVAEYPRYDARQRDALDDSIRTVRRLAAPASGPGGLAGETQQPNSLAETIAAKRQEPAFVRLAELWSTTGGLIEETRQPETHGALLATRCDACRHTLNWHRNDVGCTVVLCVCGRFQEPAAVSQPETEA